VRKPRAATATEDGLKARLVVSYLPVAELVPAERNARTHSPEQIQQIARSIGAFGWTNPILIDEGRAIIAGHGRLEAARAAGLTEVPTITLAGLSAAQKRALAIADNKLALNAGWDDELLRLELGELGLEGFDLGLIGFSDLELKDILADRTDGLTDPDDVPEPPAEPVTRLGDVWLLGRHRLVCGDCTDAGVVERALGGVKADCVFTSPPYGIGVDYGVSYEDTLDNLREMLPALARLWLESVVSGGFAVINFMDVVSAREAIASDEPCEYPMAIEYWPPFRASGWYLWSRRVWCKPNARVHSPWVMQTNRAASDWENVWTWKAPGRAIVQRINGPNQSANGWVDTSAGHGVDLGKGIHGAGMAVALPLRMIPVHSLAGGIVYEPFSGSGTTIIAAEMTGRACHAIEISPTYVDVAVLRWQAFTGQIATLAGDGRAFADIQTEREFLDSIKGFTDAT
jgi:DNA modification methylase